MPLKPRIVLTLLGVASFVGVFLTWASTGAWPVTPLASWVAIVSLGTLLTNGFLWLWYTRETDKRPERVVRRWYRIGYVASTAAVAGLSLRFLPVTNGVPAGISLVVGGFAGTVTLGGLTVLKRWSPHGEITRWVVRTGVVLACSGLVTIAWADVGMDGGAVGAVAVRALHLVAVAFWIGGAVWHNGVVVPAMRSDSHTGIQPVVKRFRRGVPLLIIVALLTGLHQATTWLGWALSTYLTTTVGMFIALKLTILGILVILVAHGRFRA